MLLGGRRWVTSLDAIARNRKNRADQIAEWVRLTEAKLVSDKLSETPNRSGRPGASAAASRELGLGERETQRAVKIAGITLEQR